LRARLGGDDGDFEMFVTEHYPALLGYAFLLTGDPADAEDLLQTGLVRVGLAWSRLRDRSAAPAYVRKILVRECANGWRSRSREVARLRRVASPGPQPDIAGQVADSDVVWRALNSLSARQRAAIVLRFYDDLTEMQIAETLGCSAGTVKSLSSRALAKLRAAPDMLAEERR